MYRVLIVEDDLKIGELILKTLSKWNYEGKIVKDFKEVIKEFSLFDPHLILLDVNLPYFDGFYWCQEIRKISTVPIIFISSRSNDLDKIMGINTGADDYIEKPFSVDLLMTKINSLIRRSYGYLDNKLNILQYNNLILNIEKNILSYHGNEIELTNNENKIMILLLKSNGSIVKRETIIEYLWDDEHFVDDNTLTVNINRLRKKLEILSKNVIIKTIKGEGYKIE